MYNTEVRIMRIFNTYGPRIIPNDGRVISNFIIQALQGKHLSIYGEGNQTRSFFYVDDLIEGMINLMNSNFSQPINIGNPDEYTIKSIAELIIKKINPELKLIYTDLPQDDPLKRKPAINLAQLHLDWEPKIPLSEGINKTIDYFRDAIQN